jgi:hypothetical protein
MGVKKKGYFKIIFRISLFYVKLSKIDFFLLKLSLAQGFRRGNCSFHHVPLIVLHKSPHGQNFCGFRQLVV